MSSRGQGNRNQGQRKGRTGCEVIGLHDQEGDLEGREVRSQGQGKNLLVKNYPRECLGSKMTRSLHEKEDRATSGVSTCWFLGNSLNLHPH